MGILGIKAQFFQVAHWMEEKNTTVKKKYLIA